MPAGGAATAAAIKFLPMIMGAAGGGKGGSGGGGGLPGGLSSGGAGKSLLSIGTGLVQDFQANKLKRQAESTMPPLVDPNQAAFLSELHQKKKSIETGADYAAGENALGATNAGTNDAILRNSGEDVGGTIQALLGSQRSTNDAKNNMLAQGEQQQEFYTSQYGDLGNKIAARKMQLQMYKSQQARAEWAAKQQSANQNLGAGAAGLMGTNTAAPSANPSGGSSSVPQVNTDVLQGMINKTAGAGGSGMGAAGEGVEGGTNAAAGMA